MNRDSLITSVAAELTSAKNKGGAHITTGTVTDIGESLLVRLAGNTQQSSIPVKPIRDIAPKPGDKVLVIYEGTRYFAIATL